MVNYLGKFIPNLAEQTAPLCNLLKKDVFELQKPQLEAIGNLKILVTSAPCLKSFDSNLPSRSRTTQNASISSVGLGTFLEQNYGTMDNEK